MAVFEKTFGVPAGHTLREVRSAPRAPGRRAAGWEWEHEEYDARGALIAVYESWTTRGAVPPGADDAGGIEGFVKYSPHGWVLRRSGDPPAGRTGGCGARAEAA